MIDMAFSGIVEMLGTLSIGVGLDSTQLAATTLYAAVITIPYMTSSEKIHSFNSTPYILYLFYLLPLFLSC